MFETRSGEVPDRLLADPTAPSSVCERVAAPLSRLR